MNYAVGSLAMFKETVKELAKEDAICDIVTEIMDGIKQAVMNRKPSIVVESALFDQVADHFLADGYKVIDIEGSQSIELSGWAD